MQILSISNDLPTVPFKNATKATNAIIFAMTPKMMLVACIAPLHAASNNEASVLLLNKTWKVKISHTQWI